MARTERKVVVEKKKRNKVLEKKISKNYCKGKRENR